MKSELKVVGIQAPLVWENSEENIGYFQNRIESIQVDIDLVVLPEMFTSGFTMYPDHVAESMEGPTMKWMKNTAIQWKTALVGTLVIKEGQYYFNRLIFMFPSGDYEYYDKRHPFSMAGEDRVYKAGIKKKIISYKGWKICPQICYDLRFPVWIRNTENYDLLLVLANWPKPRINAWNTLLKARAIENMCYTIGVNRVGKDANRHEYTGNSLIVDYLGNELSALKNSEAGIVYGALIKEEQDKMRKKLGFLNDRDQFMIEI